MESAKRLIRNGLSKDTWYDIRHDKRLNEQPFHFVVGDRQRLSWLKDLLQNLVGHHSPEMFGRDALFPVPEDIPGHSENSPRPTWPADQVLQTSAQHERRSGGTLPGREAGPSPGARGRIIHA